MTLLYFDDFAAGQHFRSETTTVTADDIKAFAASFDPQPFHMDEARASESFFRGLAASGWHTAALTMRLLVQSGLPIAGGLIGAGVDELRWPRAVRPGDVLHLDAEILECRPSGSRPEQGWVRVRVVTRNQDDAVVQTMTPTLMVPRRTV
jgi:acyl dehydratase